MSEINIKSPEDLTEKELKKLQKAIEESTLSGRIESRRSGCMLILILPLILSLTMIFLISL